MRVEITAAVIHQRLQETFAVWEGTVKNSKSILYKSYQAPRKE